MSASPLDPTPEAEALMKKMNLPCIKVRRAPAACRAVGFSGSAQFWNNFLLTAALMPLPAAM